MEGRGLDHAPAIVSLLIGQWYNNGRLHFAAVPRLSHSVRRDAIIDAALAVAIRNGLGATTARDVAAEMRTSSGLIHHYFDSMDDLLAAAFERAAQNDLSLIAGALAAEPTALRKLRAFFDNYQRADDNTGYQLWLDAWSEAARRPALRATSQRLNLAWHGHLHEVIAAGVASGEFESADPSAAAWRVLSLLDGLYLQVVAHPQAMDHSVVMGWTIEATERELGLCAGALSSPEELGVQ
jgi:AcrR family transcriptional regulator